MEKIILFIRGVTVHALSVIAASEPQSHEKRIYFMGLRLGGRNDTKNVYILWDCGSEAAMTQVLLMFFDSA